MSRIIRIVGPLPPPYGGIAVVHQRLLALLRKSGMPCESWSTGGREQLRIRRVLRLASYSAFCLRCCFGRRTILHLLSSSGANFYVNSLLGAWGRWMGHRVILSLLGGGFEARAQKGGAFFSNCMKRVRKFDAVVASNEGIALTLRSWGVQEARIHCIDNLLPNPIPEDAGAWLALPVLFREANPKVLATGALSPEYGLDTLLEGFSRFLGDFPDASLGVLLAEKHDKAYSEYLNERIRQLGLEGKVHFFRGVSEVISIFRHVDVMVRATQVDGDAVSVWEALLEGKPVVASDTGGRPVGCTLFPVGDSQALANALRQVMRREAGQSDVAGVRSRAEKNRQALLDLYTSLGAELVR